MKGEQGTEANCRNPFNETEWPAEQYRGITRGTNSDRIVFPKRELGT